MTALNDLKRKLRPGQTYRRKDLSRWSKAVDRHVRQLVEEGRLKKVSQGLYMAPRKTRFGKAPARPEKLVSKFLNNDHFLLVSPNAYNGLGVGTTQLYGEPVVYNRKRHGRYELDGQVYDFRRRPGVPKSLSREVLLVDLLHNLDRLAEDRAAVRRRALEAAAGMNPAALERAVGDFGSARARRLLEPILDGARQPA